MNILEILHRNGPQASPARSPYPDPSLYEALPFGALRLDAEGRVMSTRLADRQPDPNPRSDLFGRDLFRDFLAGTALESWGLTFREGVRRGRLYEVAHLEFLLPSGVHEVSFLLLYHQRTGEAWVFIHPAEGRANAAEMPYRMAA